MRPSKLHSRTARICHQTGGGISIDDIDISHFSSRLPRIPITGTSPPPPPPPLLPHFVNNNQHLSRAAAAAGVIHQHQFLLTGGGAGQQPMNTESSMRSPSYIFYTGHGNYHKQEINLKVSPTPSLQEHYQDGGVIVADATAKLNYDDGGDVFVPPQASHLANYSYMKNIQNIHHQNATAADHPYSNVVEESKFNNFR